MTPIGAISKYRTSPASPGQRQESTITAIFAAASAAWEHSSTASQCGSLKGSSGGARQDHYIHIDPLTCREVSLKDDMFPHRTAYIVVHVRRQGVRIEIEHPLHKGWVDFTARSHRPFTREGIIAEAKSYIDRHILLAPGRYRDLQLEHMVSREQFPTWYRQYKKRLHDRAEAEHQDMVERYRYRNDITYGEARDMLAASGIFFDLNCDEFERDEITEQFVQLCNRT